MLAVASHSELKIRLPRSRYATPECYTAARGASIRFRGQVDSNEGPLRIGWVREIHEETNINRLIWAAGRIGAGATTGVFPPMATKAKRIAAADLAKITQAAVKKVSGQAALSKVPSGVTSSPRRIWRNNWD